MKIPIGFNGEEIDSTGRSVRPNISYDERGIGVRKCQPCHVVEEGDTATAPSRPSCVEKEKSHAYLARFTLACTPELRIHLSEQCRLQVLL